MKFRITRGSYDRLYRIEFEMVTFFFFREWYPLSLRFRTFEEAKSELVKQIEKDSVENQSWKAVEWWKE